MSACWLKEKTRLALLNPLLVSAAVIIVFLLGTGVDYAVYSQSASGLGWLLTPATVCLAIPLYKQLHLLKNTERLYLQALDQEWQPAW